MTRETPLPLPILIETCKMNNVNPEAWLAWVLERIQDHPVKRDQAMLDEQKAAAA